MDVNGAAFPDMTATYAVLVRVEQPHEPLRRQPGQFVGPAVTTVAGPVVMTVGGVVAVGASFADWLRTGTVKRSSYEILGLVDRLGFAPDGPIRILVRAWPLMPLLIAAAVVAAWWGLRHLGAWFGVLGGLYAGALSVAVARAVPDRRLISVTAAPEVTAVGAATVVVGSLLAIWTGVRSAHADPR